MVKTRSNRGNSGDDSATETEVHTEYSTDFESEDEGQGPSQITVIKGPMKSQSTPVIGFQKVKGDAQRKYPIPIIDVHERQISPERPVSAGTKMETQTEKSELLDSVAEMKTMMTTFMQAMRGITEVITSAGAKSNNVDVNEPTRDKTSEMNQSHRSRSSKTVKSPVDDYEPPSYATSKLSQSHRGRSSKTVLSRRKLERDHHIETRLRSRRNDRYSSYESSDSSSSSSEDEGSRGHRSSNNGTRLPAFTGKEKWKVWYNRFQSVAELHNWNKKQRLAELLPRLQGLAGDFVYDQLSREVRGSYRKLIKELDNRFREVDTSKIYITKFNNKRQLENESIQEYAAELKRLYDKGFPTRDKITRQEDLLRQYLLGLFDEGARIHVELNKEPKTIDDAVYYTVHYQETCGHPLDFHDYGKGAYPRQKKPLRQVQSTPRQSGSGQGSSPYEGRGQGHPPHEGRGRLPYEGGNHRHNRSANDRRGERRCYNCNAADHFIRNCPEPRRPRENNYDRSHGQRKYQPQPDSYHSREPRATGEYPRRPVTNEYSRRDEREEMTVVESQGSIRPTSLNPEAPEFDSKPQRLN